MSDVAKTWLSLALTALVMGVLLFWPAGTFRYWQGWLYLILVVGGSAVAAIDLMRHDPALLKRRLTGGPWAESEPTQRMIVTALLAGFAALIALSALGRRFGPLDVPVPVTTLGVVMVALGFYGVVLVYRANSFAAATVGVMEGQRVVSTGPYAIVRHPMYSSALLYLFGTPLVLGSWAGLLVSLLMVPLLVWRLVDEERVLRERLPGYTAYANKVRWRLVPGVY